MLCYLATQITCILEQNLFLIFMQNKQIITVNTFLLKFNIVTSLLIASNHECDTD